MNNSLNNIVNNIKIKNIIGDLNKEISQITFDSRNIKTSSLFVAQKGTLVDGHKFINQSIEKGATAIFCEQLPKQLSTNITYIKVVSVAESLGVLVANFYHHPSHEIKLIGITGTNGKTTSTTLLYNLFKELGKKVALISTIKVCIDDEIIPATHTTPDVIRTNEYLQKAIEKSCEYAFMEVSSHGINQGRINGLKFTGGVFTNITHDHLDYHKTFSEYLKVKKIFFDNLPENAFALTNIDDKNGTIILQNTNAKKYTYGLKTNADYKTKIIESRLDGQLLNVNKVELWTQLVGVFNAYNITTVFAVADLLGFDTLETLTAISKLTSVDGRFQYHISESKIISIVDYAHTPDALENVLKTITDLRTNNEKLFVVVGCGGDRDKTKRPIMAKIACQFANQVFLTSDNPRTENPSMILADMEAGIEPQFISKVLTIENRSQAIKTAAMMANSHDIILIAGKGHETYQDIDGIKHPFDDRLIIKEWLNKLQK